MFSRNTRRTAQSVSTAAFVLAATLIAPQTALALSSDSSLTAPIGDSCPNYAPVKVLLQSDGTYAKGIYPANHSLYSEITPDECYRTTEDAVVLSGSPLALDPRNLVATGRANDDSTTVYSDNETSEPDQTPNGWTEEDGVYYYYSSGVKHLGWLPQGSLWYYLGPSGARATGWNTVDGARYYFNESGVMLTGWQNIGGTWFYFRDSGAVATGWISLGGTWYYLEANGAMYTGWLKQGNTWYFLESSGAMATGWARDGNTWYLFNGSGAMLTGWQKSGSTWYYLLPSGAMKTGWLKQGNTWYFLESSGAMATGWARDGNTWYLFNGSGAMLTGWQRSGNTWYYLDANGAMKTGWIQDGGSWYYLYGSGAMAANTWIGNYYVDGSGRWVRTYSAPTRQNGAVQPLSNKACPSYAPIKGNINSKGEKIYHTFSSATYDRTRPEACFATTTAASNAGYRAARD
ncbi:MAG: cell wall-binding protein [Arcanobacterium sp.]|nr:cell wall-binding protein [Arcanobacterium sp.]